MLDRYTKMDDFLRQRSPSGTFLFGDFGLAETVFTPLFMRFWFLEYYEGFDLPDDERYARVTPACEIGAKRASPTPRPAGDGGTDRKTLLRPRQGCRQRRAAPERSISSFVCEPHRSARPWPPEDNYGHHATDTELGLI